MTVTVPNNPDSNNTASVSPTFAGWDNLLKVEIRVLGAMICVDDVKLKS